jgi:hypothetical protein
LRCSYSHVVGEKRERVRGHGEGLGLAGEGRARALQKPVDTTPQARESRP